MPGTASIWLSRVSDNEIAGNSWDAAAAIDAGSLLTATLTAPLAPGLWYVEVQAATGSNGSASARAVLDVLPGPVIQLPPPQQLSAGVAHAISVSIFSPLDTPLSSGVRSVKAITR